MGKVSVFFGASGFLLGFFAFLFFLKSLTSNSNLGMGLPIIFAIIGLCCLVLSIITRSHRSRYRERL